MTDQSVPALPSLAIGRRRRDWKVLRSFPGNKRTSSQRLRLSPSAKAAQPERDDPDQLESRSRAIWLCVNAHGWSMTRQGTGPARKSRPVSGPARDRTIRADPPRRVVRSAGGAAGRRTCVRYAAVGVVGIAALGRIDRARAGAHAAFAGRGRRCARDRRHVAGRGVVDRSAGGSTSLRYRPLGLADVAGGRLGEGGTGEKEAGEKRDGQEHAVGIPCRAARRQIPPSSLGRCWRTNLRRRCSPRLTAPTVRRGRHRPGTPRANGCRTPRSGHPHCALGSGTAAGWCRHRRPRTRRGRGAGA